MANAFFSDLLATISERGRNLLRRADATDGKHDADGLIELCEALLSGRGEASGTAMAREVLDRYHDLDGEGRLAFFQTLVRDFGPDRDKLAQAIATWQAQPGDGNGTHLHFASEPRRQELIRRLNRAPGGTEDLVEMRADLLTLMDGHADLAALDRDVVHLLSSWFNRGFLVLRRIDWSTPANILEQIIRYEAVHEIRDWDDLRRRIDPVDRQSVAAERARTAVFYSISNTQRGLGGISFGNFLIKQVVEELRRELPKLDTFVTLSPVPVFMQWLQQAGDVPLTDEDRELLTHLDEPRWFENDDVTAQLRAVLEPLAAYYFLKARNPKGRVIDSVARFHLGNGARLERINWLGDLSPKGLRESAGIMVNYLYRLDDIEENHEAFANNGEVVASNSVKKLLKNEGRRLLDMRLG